VASSKVLIPMATLGTRGPRVGRLLALAGAQAGVLVLVVSALEVYLRHHETYITFRDGRAGTLGLASDRLIVNTARGRRLIPNAHVIIRNHGVSKIESIAMDINSFGFRGPEIPKEKGQQEVRVLVLGGSITWGDYLPDEAIYVRRLEKYLRELVPGRKINVINGGVGDVDTSEEVDILEERGLAVAPDLVVLEWYPNDSRPPWGFPAEVAGRGWLRQHSVLAEKAYTYLMRHRWIRRTGDIRFRWETDVQTLPWRRNRDAFLKLVESAKFDWGAGWDPDSWKIIEDELTRLKMSADKHHFKVAVIPFPVRYQVQAHFIEDAPQRGLERRAKSLGFYYLDLLPILRQHQGEELFFDQCHPRQGANDLIGRQIAEFLNNEFFGGKEKASSTETDKGLIATQGSIRFRPGS